MSRLLGFLVGLLLVVALAAALVRHSVDGLFAGDTADAAHAEPAEAVTKAAVPEAQPVVEDEPPATEPLEAVAGGPSMALEPEPQPPTRPDPPPSAESAAVGDADDEAPADEIAAPSAGAEPVLQWYAFWQPFSSELAAEGFVGRLERVTGLDYRVLSPRPGEYQVAFGYADEAERQAKLAAIEAATGLVLRSKVL